MNFTLTRKERREDGIFGEMHSNDSSLIFYTIEHAYQVEIGDFYPKIPYGEFECKRGPHRLHSMTWDFETFELQNVPGHKNILIHWGNENKNSDGCILIGLGLAESQDGKKTITSSREAFSRFMALQQGVDTFNIIVKEGE